MHSKINNIAKSAGLELVLSNSRQIIPFKFLGIGNLINQFLEIVFSYFRFGIQMYSMFRKVEIESSTKKKSIIVPAKNEEGNLEELIERIPNFNRDELEIVVDEANSILDVNKVIASILLVEDLRIQKD